MRGVDQREAIPGEPRRSERLAPGTRVTGYRIERALDRPGLPYAAYEAVEARSGDPVVLKLVAPTLSADPLFRARFLQDLLLQASLREPHILRVLDGGTSEHGLYAVTGRTGPATLARTGRPPRDAATTMSVLAAVAGALDSAHALGLVHGRLQPASIRIDADQHVYVDDFCLSGAGGAAGYAAPEQAEGGAPTVRSDVFSLAVIAHECLNGNGPAAGEPPAGAPAALEGPLRRALSPLPEDRQGSAGELVRALQSAFAPATGSVASRGGGGAARPAPAAAPPAPAPEPTRSRARVRTVLLALAAAGVAGAIALAVSGLEGERRPPAAPLVARSGPLELRAPPDWTANAAAPSLPGLAFTSRPVTLAPADGRRIALVAGPVTANGPTFVPGELAAGLAGKLPRPEIVALDDVRALRYANLRTDDGRVLDLYSVPTAASVALVACVAPEAAAALLAQCGRVAATLRMPGADPLELRPSPAYGAKLTSVLTRLAATREPALASLAAGRDRAESAAKLAAAFAAASQALEATRPPEVAASVHASVVRGLRSSEQAYTKLAAAARAGDAAAYRPAAGAAAAGERGVRGALQNLEILGYAVG
jgi:hypothetical protein